MKPFKIYEEQIEIIRQRKLLPPKNKNAPKMHQPAAILHITNKSGKVLFPIDLNKIREFSLSNNDEYVKEILQTYGYYNIINQYNKPFLNKDGSYQPNMDFLKLFSLQQMDNRIKNFIFYPILQVEQRLKTCISYEFAKAYGPFEGEVVNGDYIEPYFRDINYNQSLLNKNRIPKYEALIDRLKSIHKDNDYKPFKHYRLNHKHIPIWVFINKLTYGEMLHFYEVLKIQPNISNQFKLTPSQLRTLMLFLNQVRNDCAHFSGFYNQIYPRIKNDLPLLVKFQKEFKFSDQRDIPNIFLLLIAFKYLLPKNDFKAILTTIQKEVFEVIANQYIPQLSEYMLNKFCINKKTECDKKCIFFRNCKI